MKFYTLLNYLLQASLAMKTFLDTKISKNLLPVSPFLKRYWRMCSTKQGNEPRRGRHEGANIRGKGNPQSKGAGSPQDSCTPGTASRLAQIRPGRQSSRADVDATSDASEPVRQGDGLLYLARRFHWQEAHRQPS